MMNNYDFFAGHEHVSGQYPFGCFLLFGAVLRLLGVVETSYTETDLSCTAALVFIIRVIIMISIDHHSLSVVNLQ